jgi:hypothetical protein
MYISHLGAARQLTSHERLLELYRVGEMDEVHDRAFEESLALAAQAGPWPRLGLETGEAARGRSWHKSKSISNSEWAG